MCVSPRNSTQSTRSFFLVRRWGLVAVRVGSGDETIFNHLQNAKVVVKAFEKECLRWETERRRAPQRTKRTYFADAFFVPNIEPQVFCFANS